MILQWLVYVKTILLITFDNILDYILCDVLKIRNIKMPCQLTNLLHKQIFFRYELMFHIHDITFNNHEKAMRLNFFISNSLGLFRGAQVRRGSIWCPLNSTKSH